MRKICLNAKVWKQNTQENMNNNIFFENIMQDFAHGKLPVERLFGGSARDFYRANCNSQSYVLLVDKNKSELRRYMVLLQNLKCQNIPVPDVYFLAEHHDTLIMQDVGKLSLFEWVRMCNDFSVHLDAAKILAKVHSLKHIAGMMEHDFRYFELVLETQYFCRHFLQNYAHFNADECDFIYPDLLSIAHKVANSPISLMHRDFQSQNILLNQQQVAIVDFQGARSGYSIYDVASFIEDPYLRIPHNLRIRIFDAYLCESNLPNYLRNNMIETYDYAALQRLLQAIAAYSYLSQVKKKEWFASNIVPALERCLEICSSHKEFYAMQKILTNALKICIDKKLCAHSSY